MTTITLDGLHEEEFRRSIELRLRDDQAGVAVERLRGLLAHYAGPEGILPGRFLTVTAGDLHIYGWDGLANALRRHDRPGRPVSALSIAFGWAGENPGVPDAEGRLTPYIETGYYNDEAFPFSQSGREDLLEGYSYYGCTWTGDCVATDTILSLGGIDDLHGALAQLEARLLSSDEPDEEEIRAGSLGACLLSVLLFQAVDERIARDGLPRPLCVMAGSNGVYPYFDAPVVGMPEDARKAAEAAERMAALDHGLPAPRYSSLLMTSIPRAKKRAVLVLEEGTEDTAMRIAALRGYNEAESESPQREETQAEVDAPTVANPVIAGAPDGLLLAKKPSRQSWDFRDQLGSRAPEPPAEEAAPPEPSEPPAPPMPGILRAPSTEPGFALLEPTPQERVQSLLARHMPHEATAPEPTAPLIEAPAPADPAASEDPEGPYPSAGPNWTEYDAEAPAEMMLLSDYASTARQGLWARVRNWLAWI